jgi:hypothetical protein
MSAELSGARRILRACADAGGWPWCDEHQAPRWNSTAACAPHHTDVDPAELAWCYSCERLHGPMEWGDGCQDLADVRTAEVESTVAGFERTASRYRHVSKTVELAAATLIGVMAVVLLTASGPWVGGVALALLGTAVVVYLYSWPLQRRASNARMQAMETRWAAGRAEQGGDRG